MLKFVLIKGVLNIQERLVMAMDIVALNLCSRLSLPIIEPQMV